MSDASQTALSPRRKRPGQSLRNCIAPVGVSPEPPSIGTCVISGAIGCACALTPLVRHHATAAPECNEDSTAWLPAPARFGPVNAAHLFFCFCDKASMLLLLEQLARQWM